MTSPTSLIINSAFTEPQQHWAENPDRTLRLEPTRRPAGYEIIDTRENTRRQVPIPLVDTIRDRVRQWRLDGWPGTTAITLGLLQHWWDPDKVSRRQWPFYFCQLEAIETLIWHLEALPEYRQGIHIQGDGGEFERLCNKMATGSGKTTVMAMIITWQVLNALTYPKSPRKYSSAVFLVAPGLTVKSRLQVLMPGHENNYYDQFELCPSEALRQKLNRADILIENWHTLMPLKEQERSVVKKGKESDEAYTRRVLGPLANAKNLVVINDEAHHAYRKPADIKVSKADAEAFGIDLDEATRWVEGLDRIHKTRRIARCFDLSATPFAPTGRTNTEAGLFSWVVSDFGLNDAIEAGLVKTPRVVVRDDALPNAQTLRPKLYHLYREPDVAEDLNRKAEAHEPLPALVQQAYTLLGADWRATAADWAAQGHLSPPVMLTVCNRTETAARVEHYFTKGHAQWTELHDAHRTLRVDSKVLEKAEVGEAASADKDYDARLRSIVQAARIEPQSKERWQASSTKKDEAARLIDIAAGEQRQQQIRELLAEFAKRHPEQINDRKVFLNSLKPIDRELNVRLSAPELKAVVNALGERDENAEICRNRDGEAEPDAELRDTENVPLADDIAAYFKREVLPHAPDAWIDPEKSKVGYEIPFNRHFYVFEPPRSLHEIDEELKGVTANIMRMLEGLAE